MSDELKSFKISDQVKRTVDKPKPGEEIAAPTPSAGFPRIEALIENDSIDLEWVAARRNELLALSNASDTLPKTKSGARKAALAYKHVGELIEHLMSTKDSMLQQNE